jgi:hypothetical protein
MESVAKGSDWDNVVGLPAADMSNLAEVVDEFLQISYLTEAMVKAHVLGRFAVAMNMWWNNEDYRATFPTR